MASTPSRRTSRNTRRWCRLGALTCGVAAVTAVGTATAAPPALPHLVTSLPAADVVQLSGYPATPATVTVLRGGLRIATAGPLTPVAGNLTVNAAGSCWSSWTPDLVNGDVIRVTQGALVEDSTVQAVTVGSATDVNATTVAFHGTAHDTTGAQLAVSGLQVRLNNAAFGGTPGAMGPNLRAPGGIGNTLTYDTLLGDAWTATFTPLDTPTDVGQHAAALSPATTVTTTWTSPTTGEATQLVSTDVAGPDPACGATAPGAPFGVTTVAPRVVQPATVNVVVQGAARNDATAVTVTVSDGVTTLGPFSAGAGLSTPSGTGGQIWSLTIPAASLSALNDGPLTITPTFTVGVPVVGATGTLTKDTVAPLVNPAAQITSGPAQGSSTPSSDATFAFTTAVAETTFECRRDGQQYVACTSPTTYTNLPNGLHTFDVRVVDGTPGPVTSRSWTVDNAVPDTTITIGPVDGSHSIVSSATFEMTSTEAPASFECSLDGAPFVACVSPTTFNALPDGDHTVAIRAKDVAGNVDPTPATRAWNIKGAPTTSLSGAPPASTTVRTATFAFTSNDPNATFQCALDTTVFTPCTTPRVLTGLGDGPHTFRVRAVDQLATPDASPEIATWSVDPPTTKLTNVPPSSLATTATFGFISTNDPIATFECALDGAVFSFCASPLTLSQITPGSHSFQVRAKDANGFVDPTPETHTWTVSLPDTEPPSVTAAVGPVRKLTLARNGVLIITGTCSEQCRLFAKATLIVPNPLTPTKRGKYALTSQTIDGAAAVPGQVRLKLTARQLRAVRNSLKAGRKVRLTITVIGTDAAGNASNALRDVTLTKINL